MAKIDYNEEVMTEFEAKVFEVVRRIPVGETWTYAKVARFAGRPKAYRAVGNILHKNYNRQIPCHRVVRSDGSIGGYNRGDKAKRLLLEREKLNQEG